MTIQESNDSVNVAHLAHRSPALRARAFAKYQECHETSTENLGDLPPAEILKMIRELRIHKIELEMQNEELLQSQLALEESRSRFRDLYDHAPVGYCMLVGSDGVIHDANSTFEEMLACEPGKLNHARFCSFIEPSHQDVFYHLNRRILASRKADSCELQMRRSDGVCIWVQLSVTNAPTVGDAVCLRVSLMNIDARIKAEASKTLLENQLRESQKMEAVGTLAGGIAHDFNNILSVILANAELVGHITCQSVPDAEPFMSEIQRAALRARDLVRQILAFCRRQPTDRQVISLRDVIQESIGLLRSTIPVRYHLEFTWEDDVPYVLADSTQVEQVIINLATNAIQAMEGRGGSLRIHLDAIRLTPGAIEEVSLHAKLWQRRDQVVRIVISDDGPGMSGDIAGRIFEPFFTTKPVNQGTGLGLAVVHGIIRAHDGEISVKTKPGEGTTFTILLPAAKQDASISLSLPDMDNHSVPAKVSATSQFAANSESLKVNDCDVLYVDDDQCVVNAIVAIIKAYGINIVGYTDPAFALEMLREPSTKIKVLLTDYNMPGISGLEFARQVHALRPELPVIISSGYIDEDLKAHAQEAGVVALLEKPFAIKSFLELLRKQLQASACHQNGS